MASSTTSRPGCWTRGARSADTDPHAPAGAGVAARGSRRSTPPTPAAATAGWCWSRARPASASRAWSRRSSTGSSDARVAWSACDGAFTPSALGPLQDVADQWGGAVRVACADGVPRDTRFARVAVDAARTRRPLGPGRGGPPFRRRGDPGPGPPRRPPAARQSGPWWWPPTATTVSPRTDALRETLGDVSTLRSTRRIDLPPSSPSAVTALSAASGHEAAAVHALTGGNPFFVSEVLRGERDELPASARDAVLARAARLSAPGRDVLDAAALVGERVEPDSAGRGHRRRHRRPSTNRWPRDCWSPTARACGSATRSPVVRSSRRSARTPRAEVHRRILAELERSGADDARLAHHAEGALDAERRGPLRPARRRPVRRARLAPRGRHPVPPGAALRLRPTSRWCGRSCSTRSAASWPPSTSGSRPPPRWRSRWRLGRPRRAAAGGRRAAPSQHGLLAHLPRAGVRRGRGPCARGARAARARRPSWLGLSARAGQYMHGRVAARGVGLLRAGREMGAAFGLDDVVSDALNTQACVARRPGRRLDRIDARVARHRRARRSARPGWVARTPTCRSCCSTTLRYAEGERFYREGSAYCEEHDLAHLRAVPATAARPSLLDLDRSMGRGRADRRRAAERRPRPPASTG